MEIVNPRLVTDSERRTIVLGRNTEVVVRDRQGRERLRHRLPNGARLLVPDGDEVQKGQILAECDPHTLPVIAEAEGRVVFVDMVEGISYREVVDEATGRATREIVEWRQHARAQSLRPHILIEDEEGKPVVLPSGNEARYYLPVGAVVTVENGQRVHPGDVLARLTKETIKTRDITGGLPRVAELFEARRPKDPAIIAEVSGTIEFVKDYKNKRRLRIIPDDEHLEPVEYTIPKNKHILVQDGDHVKPGDVIVDGQPVPHDILRVLGIEALANYLVNEIQEVYRMQGVKINDKHIEVIVRQMLQKVEVVDPGDTTYLIGEQVDKIEFEQMNARMEREGRRPATAVPVLQGITKASLQTHSWISAASFQETTRVLTEAAFAGKVDRLMGLKENVIVGRLIPAGTGRIYRELKRLPKRDPERFGPPEDYGLGEIERLLPAD
ncbi:DNA-directed RNA polymerase subunit beta' [bacterium HR39]|nr:DNA-directed RNA polymerase subunit beta' [bacterium HR39]